MSAITWPGRRRGEGGAGAPRARARPPGSAYLADVLAHVLDDHLVGRDGLHGEQAPVVNVALAELELFLPELGAGRSGGVSPWSRARRPALAALRGGARPHLELVELEQIAVAAAGEGGQQAALLGAPLGARAGGRVRLRGDAHALRGRGPGQGAGPPNARGPPARRAAALARSQPRRPRPKPWVPVAPTSSLWSYLCLSCPQWSPLFPASI